MSRWVVLGHVSGLYGIQGWVKIFSETSPRENIFRYAPWHIQGREWILEQSKKQGKYLLAKLQGCSDRNEARTLIGALIQVDRQVLGQPEDGFFWTDLEGLNVRNIQGHELGRVKRLFATGANDVMVVEGEKERLIPWLWQQVILEVDQQKKLIRVDWDADF